MMVASMPPNRNIASEDLMVIRPALVSLVLERQPVTLNSLLARIKLDNPSWDWGRTTQLGISFDTRKNTYYERLKEDPANVQRRAQYLKYMFRYESEGRPFVFMDESWLNRNMVSTKIWTDGTAECEPAVPPGKGERWILIGAGSVNGWIKESCAM